VVAGLPLAARVVLGLHRAGITRLWLHGGPAGPAVGWAAAARGAPARRLEPGEAPAAGTDSRLLLVAGDALVDPIALGPLVAGPGVAVGTAGGRALAVAGPAEAVRAVLAALDGGAGTLDEAIRAAAPAARGLPLAGGLALALGPGWPAARLEAALLDDLARRTRPRDSPLALLVDRRLSRPLTRWLLPTRVTPGHVTAASLLLGLAGAAGLATGSYGVRLAGLGALVGSSVLDCVDGEIARARFERSARGARLDLLGDYAVHLATFAGLAIGLGRDGLPAAGRWAGAALCLGVLAAMVTVHRLLVRPALAGGGDLHWTGGGGLRATALGAAIERLASRDYVYLLLVLGVAGRLEWFLYAAAAGAWAFVAGVLGWAWRAGGARAGPAASA
jgi:phosphatidylglycerophosphate synthase